MRINILECELNCITMNQTIELIKSIIDRKVPTQHVVINANKVNEMLKDDKLLKIVNSCKVINADGVSILLAGKILGYNNIERVTGIDLFINLLQVSNDKGYRVYFLGASEQVVENVVTVAKKNHKDLIVAGYRNGYFGDDESEAIAEEIRKSKADVLFVGIPSPKKEFWVDKHLHQMNVPFVMGVGGSFDVYSGKTKRAPVWIQKIGMEWFIRFIQEPKRMFKRYFLGNFVFLGHVFKAKFFK